MFLTKMLIQIFRFRSNVDLAAVAGKLLMDEAVESDPETQFKKHSVLSRNGSLGDVRKCSPEVLSRQNSTNDVSCFNLFLPYPEPQWFHFRLVEHLVHPGQGHEQEVGLVRGKILLPI